MEVVSIVFRLRLLWRVTITGKPRSKVFSFLTGTLTRGIKPCACWRRCNHWPRRSQRGFLTGKLRMTVFFKCEPADLASWPGKRL
jgi:hypothetical protein